MKSTDYGECRSCAYGLTPGDYWKLDPEQKDQIENRTQLCPRCKAKNCFFSDFDGEASRARTEGEKDQVIMHLKAQLEEANAKLAAMTPLADPDPDRELVGAMAGESETAPKRGRRKE